MCNNEIDFYTKAGLLDQYIHSSDPGKYPDKLREILQILKTRPDLRDYFFRSNPHVVWARILWDHGFFSDPPSPQETEHGHVLPYWDVQGYLISVANQVPDIVLKHIETVHGHPLYISRAIEAVNFVPIDDAELAVPIIIEWLKDPLIATAISLPTFELMKRLIQGGKSERAFNLFHWLMEPMPSSKMKQHGEFLIGTEAVSKFNNSFKEKKLLSEAVEIITEVNAQQIVAILEQHLISAIRLEAEAKKNVDFEFASWWRIAIGETGQDSDHDYKDKLLQALRDALIAWVNKTPKIAESLVKRYLAEKHEILRRLGLHILGRFPKEYKKYLAFELGNTKNLYDTDIHHEFFMLLKHGFEYLDPSEQKDLVKSICKGPSKENAAKLAKFAQESYEEDPEEYIQDYSKRWIRDRLWMLKDNLSSNPLKFLNKLVSELDAPKHPAFTRWHSGAYAVQDVSPIGKDVLSKKSADELVKFIKQWKPPSDVQFAPKRISDEGLAYDLADIVFGNLEKYSEKLVSIALCRSEFAVALLDKLTKDEKASTVPWEICIELCENLLKGKAIRQSMSQEPGATWVWARKRVVDLLEEGIKKPVRAIPLEYLPRVRAILLFLSDDPDPELESDRPKEGWFGHEDPATVAINHVRPEALSNLILYDLHRIKLIGRTEKDSFEGPGPQRLEEIVREKLTQKLDKKNDPSWAVHSIFGRHLWQLYWLDKGWVEENIDKIFPEEETDENIRYYVSAWDSFVIFNRFNTAMVGMLYSKYARAIDNLSKGYKTETHLRPVESLSGHLIWQYLISDKDIPTPSGEVTLIEKFFESVKPEYRGTACWVFWRILEDNRTDLDKYWQKARMFWEWRINRASMENNSTDFDAEMQWLAHLPLIAPPSETITSMWPLLEGLLPHITRGRHGTAWRSLEKYLEKEVENHPERSIQYFYLMHTQHDIPSYIHHGKEAQKIIETAAENKISRKKALSLINVVASRLRDYQYRDVYERYA
jgi:hypothetical protein